MSRKIVVYGPDNQLNFIKNNIKNYQNELDKRNVIVKYQDNNDFRAELYGVDGGLKKTIYSYNEIPTFINLIDSMPMGKVEKALRESFSDKQEILLNKCGLPIYDKTKHCFNDETHHTCCMLGPEARKYADNSGNPIGITSENAFYYRYGKKPEKNELIPWCTCTGSKVCSYYANKFNDGTHIKFIGELDTKNEEEGIEKMRINKHETPGINWNNYRS